VESIHEIHPLTVRDRLKEYTVPILTVGVSTLRDDSTTPPRNVEASLSTLNHRCLIVWKSSPHACLENEKRNHEALHRFQHLVHDNPCHRKSWGECRWEESILPTFAYAIAKTRVVIDKNKRNSDFVLEKRDDLMIELRKLCECAYRNSILHYVSTVLVGFLFLTEPCDIILHFKDPYFFYSSWICSRPVDINEAIFRVPRNHISTTTAHAIT
jgi:hypothetical protein